MLPPTVRDRVDEETCPTVLVSDGPDAGADHLLGFDGALCGREPSGSFLRPLNRSFREISIEEYAEDHEVIVGERPPDVCKRCWSALDSYDPLNVFTDTSAETFEGPVAGTHIRWKLKGHARRVWCDVFVADDIPMDNVRVAVGRALALDDDPYPGKFTTTTRFSAAQTAILPQRVHASHGIGKECHSTETTTIGAALELFRLGEGDRLYYLYDDPETVVYGILKERHDGARSWQATLSPEKRIEGVHVVSVNGTLAGERRRAADEGEAEENGFIRRTGKTIDYGSDRHG